MSFLSLHDALSSLLPGARGAPDWALRPGMPGFGDGVDIDIDDRRSDQSRPQGPDGLHNGDGSPRPAGAGDGGIRHGHDADIPAHARQAVGEAIRGPAPPPLAPPMPQGALDPSLHALARELQQLPPSVLRQLSDALQRNPDALRSLPAQPEALVTVLSRAADAGPTPQAMAAEARRLAQGADGTPPTARGHEGEAARDARQPGSGITDARVSGDTRATTLESRPLGLAHGEARAVWAGAEPGLPPTLRAQGSAEVLAPSHAPSRPDTQATAQPVAGQAVQNAAAPAGATQAQAPPLVQDGPAMPGGRADAAGSTVDRGGQPAGFGALGGVAAGVTLAAAANPAGTTHAHAPEAAVRARGGPKQARGRQRREGEAPGDDVDAQQGDARNRTPGRAQGDGGQAGGPASAASAPASGAATGAAAAAATHRTASPGTDATADSDDAGTPAIVAAGDEQTAAGHTATAVGVDRSAEGTEPDTADMAARDPEALRSQRQQWLYWSLIVVTYACLGLALATVAPDLTGLPIPAESLGTWRNALTGAGLLTGLWAWLLARRLR